MHNGFPHTSLALSHFTSEIENKKSYPQALKPLTHFSFGKKLEQADTFHRLAG
jgi:hypothetical protein